MPKDYETSPLVRAESPPASLELKVQNINLSPSSSPSLTTLADDNLSPLNSTTLPSPPLPQSPESGYSLWSWGWGRLPVKKEEKESPSMSSLEEEKLNEPRILSPKPLSVLPIVLNEKSSLATSDSISSSSRSESPEKHYLKSLRMTHDQLIEDD